MWVSLFPSWEATQCMYGVNPYGILILPVDRAFWWDVLVAELRWSWWTGTEEDIVCWQWRKERSQRYSESTVAHPWHEDARACIAHCFLLEGIGWGWLFGKWLPILTWDQRHRGSKQWADIGRGDFPSWNWEKESNIDSHLCWQGVSVALHCLPW